MMEITQVRSFSPPEADKREVLRYALCRKETPEIRALLEDCLREAMPTFSYRVCYREFPLRVQEENCDFSSFSLCSKKLSDHLRGCRKAVLFAATVGVGIDRLIIRDGRLSPSKALLFQALGAERIEALCDRFCDTLKKESSCLLRARFSPGYGDLPLETQKTIFSLLEPGKHIGLTLNESLLMSPSKSVTAFVGLQDKETI